jgi:hypothetical protein
MPTPGIASRTPAASPAPHQRAPRTRTRASLPREELTCGLHRATGLSQHSDCAVAPSSSGVERHQQLHDAPAAFHAPQFTTDATATTWSVLEHRIAILPNHHAGGVTQASTLIPGVRQPLYIVQRRTNLPALAHDHALGTPRRHATERGPSGAAQAADPLPPAMRATPVPGVGHSERRSRLPEPRVRNGQRLCGPCPALAFAGHPRLTPAPARQPTYRALNTLGTGQRAERPFAQ